MPDNLDVTVCNLPTEYGAARCYAFREDSYAEHLALVWQRDPKVEVPIVRVHSECLTGDVFRSLRCDCGEQLGRSLKILSDKPYAVLIYMRGHEGRGVGLYNKIQAYRRQQMLGEDTIDANLNLGLPSDARSYHCAGLFLQYLSIKKIKILTNNMDKVRALSASGVVAVERLPLVASGNEYSRQYLLTKANRMGHLID